MASECESSFFKQEQQYPSDAPKQETLSDAQKARAERNRQKAHSLREARLVQSSKESVKESVKKNTVQVIDSGGGFFLEEESSEPPRLVPQPSPFIHPAVQPYCLECNQQFPQSYLLDTFDYNVCDACRDDEDKHSLITRTEAKSDYLLKDCDLDLRTPALRCIRRRNPHRAQFAEMRLYLRAQVAERALVVWGSEEALEAERAMRRDRSERAAHTQAKRRLRALRMDVRSSLYDRTHATHEHEFGPESYDEEHDHYERKCACGHTETYEKM